VHRADQTSLIGVVVYDLQVDFNPFAFQQHRCPTDGKLADPAAAKSAPDYDFFRVFPLLMVQKSADYLNKLVQELFNCTLHNASRFGVAMHEQVVQFGLSQFIAFLISERIFLLRTDLRIPSII
jgi:hypothetical protein